jgi:hypothetical protein
MWLRIPLFLLTALVVTGCGRNPNRPANLTSEQVSGVYELCSLVFVPGNTLFPAVDVRATVTDTAPDPRFFPVPHIQLTRTVQQYQLEYVRQGESLRMFVQGRYSLGPNTVTLAFPSADTVAAALLLPNPVTMRFDLAARTLAIGAEQLQHDVPRARYAALAGVSEDGLGTYIRGSLSGRFAPDCN